MTINKELMERYVAELETTEIPQTKGRLFDDKTGAACALGIGVKMLNPNISEIVLWITSLDDFLDQLGVFPGMWDHDIPLNNKDTVSLANDIEGLSFWDIAQRLRAKYLKEES